MKRNYYNFLINLTHVGKMSIQ